MTEVCLHVGFASLGTFSARFTEITGMAPTAYREESSRRGGPAPIPGCYALMYRTGLPQDGKGVTSQEAPGAG